MGKIQKMVWPQGKNLKPLPKGRAPLQPIPAPRPRKGAVEKREDQEYRLAISKGSYPRGRSPMQALLADPFLRSWLAAMARPDQADSRPTCTVADPASTGRSMPELKEVLQLLAETPVPSREPIEVTEAQYQALTELPIAGTPAEAMELARTFGTAILVVKPDPEPLEGEILSPVTLEELMQQKSTELTRYQDAMMLAAITGCWKLP